jgi:hypothetical protein
MAGDFLVTKCPSWKWMQAETGAKEYLRPEKQYLMTEAISNSRPTYMEDNTEDDNQVDFVRIRESEKIVFNEGDVR